MGKKRRNMKKKPKYREIEEEADVRVKVGRQKRAPK